MFTGAVMTGRLLCKLMTLYAPGVKANWMSLTPFWLLRALEPRIASRSVPAPESAGFHTVNVAGTCRASNASSCGRRAPAGRGGVFRRSVHAFQNCRMVRTPGGRAAEWAGGRTTASRPVGLPRLRGLLPRYRCRRGECRARAGQKNPHAGGMDGERNGPKMMKDLELR